MGVTLSCPCGAGVPVSAVDAGREVRCPGCDRPTPVPPLSELRARPARPDLPPEPAGPAAAEAYRRTARPGWPVVTPLALAVNLLAYGAMVAAGVSPTDPTLDDRVAWGALFGPKVGAGEWWRLLTATALHGGAVHLLFNMLVLYGVGRWVEALAGAGGTVVIYLAAALGGSVASLAWNPGIVSVGASGAVFGLFGALAALTLRGRDDLPPAARTHLRRMLVNVGVSNLVFSALVSGLDHAAHLGGLAVGVLAGALVGLRLPGRDDGPAGGTCWWPPGLGWGCCWPAGRWPPPSAERWTGEPDSMKSAGWRGRRWPPSGRRSRRPARAPATPTRRIG